jgi:hypothetical protein
LWNRQRYPPYETPMQGSENKVYAHRVPDDRWKPTQEYQP